ncbi:uncharacterized protein AKAW2_11388S [Aspergillus luchuensis]|uniref:Uncharacterized protein n=1 Tax=Aspergillus kawachii TaxID=1069201 RepID=A0A7R7W0X2_ASPKA|nr:uncharacterized protein AKAW2_11388S [Aspergillus luchuensis]BCR94342.1 hypothetical protein AKAW2_11388S [Aspergillus luchuensis]
MLPTSPPLDLIVSGTIDLPQGMTLVLSFAIDGIIGTNSLQSSYTVNTDAVLVMILLLRWDETVLIPAETHASYYVYYHSHHSSINSIDCLSWSPWSPDWPGHFLQSPAPPPDRLPFPPRP